MKMIKNDSRYIIKKIIIGVGIALILSFLKTNNVFALEKNVYMDLSWTGFGSDNNFLMYNNLNLSNNDKIFNFEFFSSNLTKWNFQTYATFGQVEPKYYIVYYNSNLNAYYYNLFYGTSAWLGNITLDLQTLNCDDTGTDTEFTCLFVNNTNVSDENFDAGMWNNSFFLSDSSILSSLQNYSSNLVQYQNSSNDNQNNFDINLYYTSKGSIFTDIDSRQFFNDFKIISTNIPNIFINGTKQEVQPQIPSGYSEINLTGNDAVYFVPKNYSTINTNLIDNKEFIDFNYYYKGQIREGYFNLKNNNQIVFLYDLNSSGNFTYTEKVFPKFYNEDGMINYSDLCSYIIFNNNLDTNSIIYYDSTLFDYYLVEDMSNYSNTINIINENNQNESIDINFYKTIQEIWEQGFDTGGEQFYNYDSNKTNLYKMFDIIKMPFTFLKRLNRNNCSPLTIPIPFVNGSFSIPCLDNLFHTILGNYYSIFQLVISAIILYNCFLSNFYCVMDVLRPTNDKVEVVDL